MNTTWTGAEISEDDNHRLTLWRRWNTVQPRLGWVMLNPSTADAHADDPTIRKCKGFARRWNFGGIIVCNLLTWRATDPKALASVPRDDRNHARADEVLQQLARDCDRVVVGWGAHGDKWPGRVREVSSLLGEVSVVHLGLTKSGQPRHPLYIPYHREPQPWGAPS